MSKDISNSIKSDAFDDQDDLSYSRDLETVGFKYGGKIGKFKDDKKYVLGNYGDNVQDKIL